MQQCHVGCFFRNIPSQYHPQTSRVTEIAHACGTAIEGILGFIGGVEGENAINNLGDVVYTSFEEAKVYVERTKIDFLAVSVGTMHGRQPNRSTKLDFKRLKRINDELGIPLVLAWRKWIS